jgi:hypothetical protein
MALLQESVDVAEFPGGAATSLASSLSSSATSGNLLVSVMGTDKSAGSAPSPSTGWTLVEGSYHTSVSGAMAYRVADGGANDTCTWSWTTTQYAAAWIGEFDWDGSAPNVVSDIENTSATSDSATGSIALGALTANGAGLAVAMVAIDTVGSWGTPVSFSGDFTNETQYTTGDSNPGGFVAYDLTVADSDSVSTTATPNSGTDQTIGILGVFGSSASAGTAHEGSVSIAGVASLSAAGVRGRYGSANLAGAGELTASAVMDYAASVSLAGVGSLSVAAAESVSTPADTTEPVTLLVSRAGASARFRSAVSEV